MICQIGLPAAMILTDLVSVSDTFQTAVVKVFLISCCWLKTQKRMATANASTADNDILVFLMLLLQRIKPFFVTPFLEKSTEWINSLFGTILSNFAQKVIQPK